MRRNALFHKVLPVLTKYLEIKDALAAADLMDTDDVYDIYGSVKDVIGNIGPAVEEYVQAEYDSIYASYEKMNGVVDTAEEFAALREYLNEQLGQKFSFDGLSDTIDEFLVGENGLFGDFLSNTTDAAAEVEDDVGTYKASLSDLSETLTNLQSAYTLLETAQKEMSTEEGLSANTIKSLAEASEDYLDYLYEENGVVKLNTGAWKQNADAKMLGEMDELQKEIDSINDENSALEDLIKTYEEKRLAALEKQDLTAYYDYYHVIDDTNAKIQENNAAIEENQAKLAIYSSLYGSITGDLNAYSSALRNFSNVANSIDSVTGSFQTLANLQAEVADGFTMSLDKALEFAKVYPEILNSAQATADGQIMLNEGVVNSFIEGKKAELDTQIDARITELEADKEVLQAKMEMAQAQLDLAKNVGDGDGQIAKDIAEYRIKTSNEMVKALIDNGADEAEAFRQVAQAMSLNTEEFDRVAMEVCTDVDSNFNNAAYNAAMGICENMKRAKTDINSVTKQAHEAAKAVGGIGDGVVRGVTNLFNGSIGGINLKGIDTKITIGEFSGSSFDFDFKEASFDDFISQLELDISSYQNAINQIDGQIAALQALKNAPLKTFSGDDHGGGGDPNTTTKDVDEYIASIDEYREAVERLRKAQEEADKLETEIENSGSFEEKIKLQEKLIATYYEEQAALHNLNNMRDSTITQGVKSLRELGFAVQYNADTNELWIENLEHLNDLTADSAGEYDSLQEATNALREGTEDLIDAITDLNDANREGSESWWEQNRSIIETTISMYENMMQARKNAAMLAENGMDNAIGIQNLEDVKKFSAAIITEYQNMQKILHEEAEYYRSLGYSDTSDEVSALSDAWWDCQNNIQQAKQRIVDYLLDVVSATSEAVDGLQNVYQTLRDAADEYAQNGGFISIDAYQSILDLGPQYMQFLKDENGLLVINRERIEQMIAAKTKQLALDNAMMYVERLKLALQKDSIEDLNELLFATTETTGATWDLVCANLAMLGLGDEQYQAALHNINAMRSLADAAVDSIGKTVGGAKGGFTRPLHYIDCGSFVAEWHRLEGR